MSLGSPSAGRNEISAIVDNKSASERVAAPRREDRRRPIEQSSFPRNQRCSADSVRRRLRTRGGSRQIACTQSTLQFGGAELCCTAVDEMIAERLLHRPS